MGNVLTYYRHVLLRHNSSVLGRVDEVSCKSIPSGTSQQHGSFHNLVTRTNSGPMGEPSFHSGYRSFRFQNPKSSCFLDPRWVHIVLEIADQVRGLGSLTCFSCGSTSLLGWTLGILVPEFLSVSASIR